MKKVIIVLLIAVSLSSVVVFASGNKYPPDNAAVLYYSAFANYEVDREMGIELNAVRDVNDRPVSSEVREFVKEKWHVIKALTDAGEIEKCNWALDPSLGIDLPMSYFSKARECAILLVADAYIKAEDKQYKEALERCLTASKLGYHLGDDLLLNYLVAIAIDVITSEAIRDMLSDDIDLETLKWLKAEIEKIETRSLKGSNAAINDYEIFSKAFFGNYEKFKAWALENDFGFYDYSGALKKIGNEDMYKQNLIYYKNYILQVSKIFELPYAEGLKRLAELNENIEKSKSKEVLLTQISAPTTSKMIELKYRHQAEKNGLKTALNIFIAYKETGNLPKLLDADWPGDPFSDKPFIYNKTENGFVIKCAEENMPDMERRKELFIYEFEI